MAENSRMSKLSEKEDECIFSWKLFTGWDFMIGNTETAHNRIASVILGFKEALLEEAEKKKDLRNWRIIALRALVNICVVLLLAISAYAVVHVVSRSDDNPKYRSWWREYETTIVVTVISITFPFFFELLGFLEHYHPRKQLRLQLARIMLLNLLNLYSLIFALFSKIEGMSRDLDILKPTLSMNVTAIPDSTLNISETYVHSKPMFCVEKIVPCGPCTLQIVSSDVDAFNNNASQTNATKGKNLKMISQYTSAETSRKDKQYLLAANLEKYETNNPETTTISNILVGQNELTRLRNLIKFNDLSIVNESNWESNDYVNFDNDTETSTMTISTVSDYDDESSPTNTLFWTANDTTSTFNTITELNEDNEFTYSTTTDSESENPSSESTDMPTDYYGTSDISSIVSELYVTMTSNNFQYSLETSTSAVETEGETESESPRTTYNEIDSTKIETSSTGFVTTQTTLAYTNTALATKPITLQTSETYETSTDKAITDPNIPEAAAICPDLSFNCSVSCEGRNITQVFTVSNCTVVDRVCYETKCDFYVDAEDMKKNQTNATAVDIVYIDENNNKQYNLTVPTRKKLMKLCWETMFGQELVKLTMMDLVFVLLGTLFMDFFRALFVRYMNRCWCWDLEKKFPEYGDFKIAENILHLINNQGMVWMGMFFSPGLVVLNVAKLMIMMYLRSWAVMTCNVPHEVVFRVSKSNNFYLALLLTMLFLCVLPVGYTIVWVKPSWHCGPFSEYDKMYYILTNNIYKILPTSLNFALEYIASPAIVIPLLVLLILIIYYLTSLTNSLREANNDLKIQLRRERTEERRKMFQLADTRGRAGSSAMDNTPFARWKKALPSLPLNKSIDSDDRKTITGEENPQPLKVIKKKGGIFAKIVNMALDKKTDTPMASPAPSPFSYNMDDETDTDFHETLPKEILKVKDITVSKSLENKKKNSVEFKTDEEDKHKAKHSRGFKVKLEGAEDRDKKAVVEKQSKGNVEKSKQMISKAETKRDNTDSRKINEKQTSESSTQSRQSDSIGSVIPVIMISTTESDEEVLHTEKGKKDTKTKEKKHKEYIRGSRAHEECNKVTKKSSSDSKSLRRQSSVDSIEGQKATREVKPEEGPKFQYSL